MSRSSKHFKMYLKRAAGGGIAVIYEMVNGPVRANRKAFYINCAVGATAAHRKSGQSCDGKAMRAFFRKGK